MGLLAHQDVSRYVTEQEVRAVPRAASMGRHHRPITHGDFLDALYESVDQQHFTVTNAQFALANDGARLFGVLEFSNGREPREGLGNMLGFRKGDDQSLAISLVSGFRVFVCDNMALHGDAILLTRKQTTNFEPAPALERAFARFYNLQDQLHHDIEGWKRCTLSEETRDAALYRTFHGLNHPLPQRMGKIAAQQIAATEIQHAGRLTWWDLYQALTAAAGLEPRAYHRMDRSWRAHQAMKALERDLAPSADPLLTGVAG